MFQQIRAQIQPWFIEVRSYLTTITAGVDRTAVGHGDLSSMASILDLISRSWIVYKTAFLFVFGSIIFFSWRKSHFQGATVLADYPVASFFSGLGIFCIIPVMIAFLSITVVGIPFAIVLTVLYLFLWAFYELWIVIIMTALITKVYFQDLTLGAVLVSLCLILGLSAIFAFVPLLDVVLAWFAIGASTLHLSHTVKKL